MIDTLQFSQVHIYRKEHEKKMKICERACFIENAGTSYEISDNSGIDMFANNFIMNIMNSQACEFKKLKELKSKTLKGHLTELSRSHYAHKRELEHKTYKANDYTLIFFERKQVSYSVMTYDPVYTGKSWFSVYKVREETPEEAAAKLAKKKKMNEFDIGNLKMAYVVKVQVSSNTGLKLPLKNYDCITASTFDEAKAFVDKMRKAWHMQMTLNGLSSDIKHDFSNCLTVYKGKCSKKYISRFLFSITGTCKYVNSNDESSTASSEVAA